MAPVPVRHLGGEAQNGPRDPSKISTLTPLRVLRDERDVETGATVCRHGGGVILRPRGPRSCPSYAVSNRHHLIDPIRPTREHIAISPHGGLYAMPSLCGSAEAAGGSIISIRKAT